MHFNHNELVLIYNAKDPKGKRVLAYASALSPRINRQDLCSVNVSATLFEKAVVNLGVSPKELINRADHQYQEKWRGTQLSTRNWFELLKRQPEMLRAPIAMYKGKTVLCDSEADILKLTRA